MKQGDFQCDVWPRIKELAEAFDRKAPSEAMTKVWWNVLSDLESWDVVTELNAWAKTKNKFPAPAEVYAAASQRGAERRDRKAAAEKARAAEEIKRMPATPEGKRAAQEAKALIQQMAPSRSPKERANHAWAYRILDRIADGEQMPDISMRYACAVLGIEGHAVTATIQAARAKEAGR